MTYGNFTTNTILLSYTWYTPNTRAAIICCIMCTKVQIEEDDHPGQLVPGNVDISAAAVSVTRPAVLQARATAVTIVAPSAQIPTRPGTGRRESRWPPQHMHYPPANGISHPFYNRIGRAVHGIPTVGHPDYDATCPTCNPMLINQTSVSYSHLNFYIMVGIFIAFLFVFVVLLLLGVIRIDIVETSDE